MTVTTECTLTVGIADLIAALKSVVPHVVPARLGDDELRLSRVRFVASADELLVAATNGTTAALAAVRIEADSRKERFAADDGSFVTDLHPAKARDLIRMVKPVKDDDELVGDAELVFTATDITATDESGLWPGQSITVPILGQRDDFPDLASILGRALAEAAGIFKPLVSAEQHLTLFEAAARAYKKPISLEPVGDAGQRGFVVLCGDRFVGSMQSPHQDGDAARRRDMERHSHLVRLGVANVLETV